ncbi:MAG: PAS domain S-box protein, partial [Bacteroidota bacterium]
HIIIQKKGDFSLFHSGSLPKIGHAWDAHLTPYLVQRIAPLIRTLSHNKDHSADLYLPRFHPRLDLPVQPLLIKLKEIKPIQRAKPWIIISFEVITWLPEPQLDRQAVLAPENYLDMLEATVQQVQEAILITDWGETHKPPVIQFINQAFSHLFGYSPAEVLGRLPEFMLGKVPDGTMYERIGVSVDGLQPKKWELFLSKKEGSQFWAELGLTPIHDRQGQGRHWVYTIRDISERKQSQALRAQSEANLTALINTTKDMILSLDDQGNLLTINDSYVELLQQRYGLQVKVGDPILSMIPEERRRYWQLRIDRALAGEEVHEEQSDEFYGETRFFAVSLNPIRQRGAVIGCAIFCRNITEHRRDQSALQLSNQFLDSLVDIAPIALYTKDLEGRFTFVNAKMASLLQRPVSSILGQSSQELLAPDYAAACKARDQQLFAEHRPQLIEQDYLTEGQLRHFQHLSFPLLDRENAAVGIGGIVWDVTEQVELDRKTQRARELAEEMARLKTNFLANMSHEIRTPLNGILGLLPILRRETNPHTRGEIFDMLDRSGQRLLNTLTGILDLARSEAEQGHVTYRMLDLSEAVVDIFESLRSVASSKGLDYHLQPLPGQAFILAEAVMVNQILTNLVGNALKFTETGQVQVSLTRQIEHESSLLVVHIQDTGVGISPDHVEKVFLPFTQESEGTKRQYEGTGLGLSIAKRYTEMVGGRIEVSSIKGQGSHFQVFFPEHQVE